MKPQSLLHRTLWVTGFAIAMALVECAIVVYLREIYYPEGFEFPLKPMGRHLVSLEFWREAGTIVMLLAVGVLAGRNLAQRLSWFLFGFAIWDIFYYVWLKVFLGWPSSLFTWDILFLIPVPWVGPVITPVLVSILMIVLAGVILFHEEQGRKVRLQFRNWLTFSVGSVVLILSWAWDYCRTVIQTSGWDAIWTLSDSETLFDSVQSYVPLTFEWVIFSTGLLICSMGVVVVHLQTTKQHKRMISLGSQPFNQDAARV